MTAAIVEYDGKVQMHACGAQRIAGIVALIAQQGARPHENVMGPRRESNKGIPLRVGHVGVVGPNRTARVQRVVVADDDCRFPAGLAGKEAVVGGIDGRFAGGGAAENIDALMPVGKVKNTAPEIANIARGGEEKRGIAAAGEGFHLPVGVLLRMPDEGQHPLRAGERVHPGRHRRYQQRDEAQDEHKEHNRGY